eukprot:TRINITY_DN2700_c0_g1_i1.p1 TRINITY_DN2700_c0_g1~~TRINITY_DN2700_c0_g1_i1.p1  ORF type:complete len:256 (+),score=52.05 TRINITY_DN2700_c0_g1_i1:46-768(+)
MKAAILLLAGLYISSTDGAVGWPKGTDFDLSDRLTTSRWMGFYPNRALFGESVEFTFRGFWASRAALTVRLATDETCTPEYVADGGSTKLEELTLVNRKATFLMPANQTRDTDWTGGFCIKANGRWHFTPSTLSVTAPYPDTSELMKGYQNCKNMMYHTSLTVPKICGCWYTVKLPSNTDNTDIYNPVTLPTTMNNRDLFRQRSTQNIVQGCCQRWTPVRTTYTIADTTPEKKWGYCADN